MQINLFYLHGCEPTSLVVSESRYHATGSEFDSDLGNVHSIFHSFRVNKISTMLAWKLNTGGLALGWPPDCDTCDTVPKGRFIPHGQENRVGTVGHDSCRL